MDRNIANTDPLARAEAQVFYGSRAWSKLRSRVIREEGCCRHCQAKYKPRARFIVDHIIPRRARPDLELDRRNLQLLCSRCHEKHKAEAERTYFGRKDAIDSKPTGVDASGRHTNPGHPWFRHD